MTDSATISEAIDVLDRTGWKGYAHAVREMRDKLATTERERDEARAASARLVARWNDLADGYARNFNSGENAAGLVYRECAQHLAAALARAQEPTP
jgi:hypothetical protein